MAARIEYRRISPAGISSMRDLENYVRQCGLETSAIIAINGWNRLAVSFRAVPGSYVRDKAGTPAEVVL